MLLVGYLFLHFFQAKLKKTGEKLQRSGHSHSRLKYTTPINSCQRPSNLWTYEGRHDTVVLDGFTSKEA